MDLPIDVLLYIIAAVDDTHLVNALTLHALCRTSRLFHQLATPALYRAIRLRSYGALYSLSQTLDTRQGLGVHTRSFVETHPFLYDEAGPNAMLPGILKHMPYLRELRIISPLDVDAESLFWYAPNLRTLAIARPTVSIVAALRYLEAPLEQFEIGTVARQEQPAVSRFLLRIRGSVTTLAVDIDVLRFACRSEPNAVWQSVQVLRLQGPPPQHHAPQLPFALAHAFPAVASMSWRSTSDPPLKPYPLAPESKTLCDTFWARTSGQALNVVGGLFASVR